MTATLNAIERLIVDPTEVLDTPTMAVDETILHLNISEMAALAASHRVALRPHIKTHKTPQIAQLQLAAGAVGLTCAKLGEAEVMADSGASDILIAYPFVGELKYKRLLSLMERVRMIIALDSLDAAHFLAKAMSDAARTIEVYVEINTGGERSGVLHGDDAVKLALNVARLPGLQLIGIMTHEGHANAQPPETIEQVAIEAGKRIVATAETIRSHRIELPVISVGSTPAARYTPTVHGVTEMRPGTYVFKDTSAFRYPEFGPDRCAARVLATIASHPAADRVILDCGSKTLTSDKTPARPGHGYILGHPNAYIDRLSEEHGVVEIRGEDPGFKIGEQVEVIPNHICPAINLMDDLTIVCDGHVVDKWKVAARGKIQ